VTEHHIGNRDDLQHSYERVEGAMASESKNESIHFAYLDLAIVILASDSRLYRSR